jgi:hypothetical protein
MPLWRRGLVISASIGSMVAACALYDQSLLLPAPKNQEAGADASPAAPVDGGTQVDAGCMHATAPSPPATDDPSTGPNVDFVVAASYFRVVTGAEAKSPRSPSGLDLDGVCTCPGAPTCNSPTSKGVCDLDGGADDNGGVLFAQYASVDPTGFSDMGLSTGVTTGNNGLLYRVKGYNGKPNDTSVTLIAYESSGSYDSDGGVVAPKLDGNDVWSIAPSSLLGGDSVDGGASCEGNDTICIPVFFDTKAYVVNGTLVAHLDHPFFIGFAVSRIQSLLSDSVLIAPLVASGQGFKIDDGTISGRWSTTKFLTALQAVTDPLGGGALCGDSGTYQDLKNGVCTAADVMVDPGKDNMGVACDAFSFQVSFSAVPAHLGPVAPRGKLRAPCGTTYEDHCP